MINIVENLLALLDISLFFQQKQIIFFIPFFHCIASCNVNEYFFTAQIRNVAIINSGDTNVI